MKKRLKIISSLVVTLTLLFNSTATAGATGFEKSSSTGEISTPKEEFRGAWVSTVFNIDWPSDTGLSIATQKQQYLNLVNEMDSMNLNAVIFQVRSMGDAIYPSNYAPWSKYLTGNLGQNPGYDPLQFAVEEAHKKNMEFHAWFNPFRISSDPSFNKDLYISKLPASSPLKSHPEWIVNAGNYYCLNPGVPEARQYIIDLVLEVVKNYDIDAVHFDDYFYPGTSFPDSEQFASYGKGFSNINDWRRDNVNKLISQLYSKIKAAKSYVKFGVSPSGIWRNSSSDPNGSATSGKSHYETAYADSVKWINEGWLDYIIPQVYWYIGQPGADYAVLTQWWANQVKGKNTHLYMGQAAYKVNTSGAWLSGDEILKQVNLNRQYEAIKGNSLFSISDVLENKLGIKDNLKNISFKSKAIIPAMPWIDSSKPSAPFINSVKSTGTGMQVNWTNSNPNDTSYYFVYRFNTSETITLNNPSKIVGKVQGTSEKAYTFLDTTASPGESYYYVVTSVDRGNNESNPSNKRISSGVKIYNFTIDKPSPQKVYSLINLSANGEGNSGELLYKFSVYDGSSKKLIQDYSTSSSCEWVPSKAGDYTIILEAKNSDSPNSYDVIMESKFRIDALKKIFLDPGHGGSDSGAVGYYGTYEKNIVLPIGLKLRNMLTKNGIDIMMSRTSDTYPTLAARTTMANNWKSDLFVSLHTNSVEGSTTTYGLETFHYPGEYTARDVASIIQSYLIRNTGTKDRGVKSADFYVLRETDMTSVLVEFGFMSNPQEETKLNTDSYQTLCAQSVADALLDYYDINPNDLNKDSAVDIRDYAFMAKRYNTEEASANWNEGLDFNGDKIIDIYDLVNFSKKIN